MSTGVATLAFDEGPGVGLGHRRRIEAIAAELEARGWWCSTVVLHGAVRVCGSVLVVDSYRARADDAQRFGATAAVVALDDLARDLDVALVVDPSPGADAAIHRRAHQVLAGGAYALAAVPPCVFGHAVDVSGPVERILVTTGASDADGVGAQLAGTLARTFPSLQIRLVQGPWGSTDAPAGVDIVRAPAGLAEELAAASLVVTAGGVSMLESCRLGRPTVAVELAANQRQAIRGLAAEGAVVPSSAPVLVGDVAALLEHADRRVALADAARRAVDGKGPARVADAIEAVAR
jgi:spore coat polysaccharide biosynthesis predicted glycosyltransferase SpsG